MSPELPPIIALPLIVEDGYLRFDIKAAESDPLISPALFSWIENVDPADLVHGLFKFTIPVREDWSMGYDELTVEVVSDG